jgi:signal transduction histidine kinase
VLVFSVAYPLWIMSGREGHLLQSLPALTAMYLLGAWNRPLWLRAIGLITVGWMVTASVIGWWDADPLEVGYVAVMFVVVWALGVVVAARRSYAEQLEAKTVALEEARRELADRAVADERARIARELHDIIAHAMSVITIRAGVGAHLIADRPAEAAEALGVIERTGREALSEMRRMLTVLRDPDPRMQATLAEPANVVMPRPEPQPGLAEVPRLIAQASEAGVAATLTTEGRVRPLPAGLDLAAYRVVQEALTNVVKHAPGARASVIVRNHPEWTEIEVHSAGNDPAGAVTPGQGLRGMAERIALYDGRLEVRNDEDGFRVTATFPWQAAT